MRAQSRNQNSGSIARLWTSVILLGANLLSIPDLIAQVDDPVIAADHAATDGDQGVSLYVQTICNDIYLESPRPINFNESEKTLICGDKDTEAWANIPFSQAAYFINAFLQARGYHRPEVTISDDRLQVRAGPITLVNEIEIIGSPIEVDIERYWAIYGRPLTPKALDELEEWLRGLLGHYGLACPDLEVEANPITGIVSVTVHNPKIYEFPKVVSEPIPGLLGGVASRYYAFDVGDTFDSRLLELTSRRMIKDEVVISTHFLTKCIGDQDKLIIEQRTVAGEPRLISFGIGFDTEEYLILQSLWRNSRLGETASQVEISAFASYRTQQIQFLFDWYYAPIITNHFIRSIYSYRRDNEKRYDIRTTRAEVGPTWANVDVGGWGSLIFTGLTYQFVETARGVGPDTTGILAWQNRLDLQTHTYEYFAANPREGHSLSLNLSMARQGMGSEITANRYTLSTTSLWNMLNLQPPIWIIGLRSYVATTTIDHSTQADELPPNYRYFLGGSHDLRGFGRAAVPPTNLGALTVAYAGLETRITTVLPFGIQPIGFIDFGKMSDTSLKLDETLYWSPGFGVHWKSPVGTFRATLAHGLIEGKESEHLAYLSRWQFYLNYGEQF